MTYIEEARYSVEWRRSSFPDSVLMFVCEGLDKNQAWADHSEECFNGAWADARTVGLGGTALHLHLRSEGRAYPAGAIHPPPRVWTGTWDMRTPAL